MTAIGKSMIAGAVVLGLAYQPAAAENWDMPTPYGDKNFHTANIMVFAEDVKNATGGELEITVHSAGSLIKHPEIKNTVRRGLVPIGEVLMSRLGNEDAVFEVDSVPFLATSYEDAKKLWDASRPIIEKKLAEENLMLLFAVPWPPQGLYAKQEVKSLDDLKGTKFRAYNTSTERLAELAGAVPTQVEVPDIPTAFTTGRVDAMMTSPSTGANTKAWDYVSFFHDTQAWLPKNMVIVNKKAFDGLDEKTQKAILDAAAKAEERGWAASKAETDEKIAVMKENGMTIVEPSDALKQGLTEIGKTMTGEWAEKAGAGGQEILSVYQK
jgi:TRAP-type C4-dicarboxylate transport system substrate-binding protein